MKALLKLLTKKNETGFSLIELMIVVVIIGILSTVAVPQYQNFQKKARQGEAKANLSGIFTTMKTFQAEWNAYYGDFRALGYDQTGQLGYNVGFTASHANGPANHPDPVFAGKAAVQFNSKVRCGPAPAKNPECGIAPAGNFAVAAKTAISNVAGKQTFVVGATGNIDSDAVLDTWSINQLKALSNPTSDINN